LQVDIYVVLDIEFALAKFVTHYPLNKVKPLIQVTILDDVHVNAFVGHDTQLFAEFK